MYCAYKVLGIAHPRKQKSSIKGILNCKVHEEDPDPELFLK